MSCTGQAAIGRPAMCEELARGDALELVWAPRICSCRPDVTLGLGHDPPTD
jgi:hypothetical protein